MSLYCNAPFMSLRVKENCYGLCCMHTDYSRLPIEEYDKRDEILKDIRADMVVHAMNNLSEICKYCTAKHKFNSLNYEDACTNVVRYLVGENVKPYFLEVSLGNTCNNNCKICDPGSNKNVFVPDVDYVSSSKYIGKDLSLGDKAFDLIKEEGDYIKYIEFIGGEPFLYTDTMYKILEDCPNVEEVRMVSNGSIFDKDFFDYLKHRGITLYIAISVDGTRDTHKWLRGWSDYGQIMDNVWEMSLYHNVNIAVNTTVSILNVYDLPEIISDIRVWLGPNFPISLLLVKSPSYYSISSVSDELKDEIRETLKRYSDISGYHEVINYLNDKEIDPGITKEEILQTLKYHDDKIGLDTKDYLHPRVYEYLGGNYED